MVERLGGRITVDSTPGVGSVFSVFLPHHSFRGLS
jgi:signal transduction histidine kinase